MSQDDTARAVLVELGGITNAQGANTLRLARLTLRQGDRITALERQVSRTRLVQWVLGGAIVGQLLADIASIIIGAVS